MNDSAREWLYAAGTFAATGLCVLLARLMLEPLVRKLAGRSGSDLDTTLVDLLALPVYLAAALIGGYAALVQLSALEAQMATISQWFTLLGTLLGFFTLLRTTNGLLRRYARVATEHERLEVVPYVTVIRKIVTITLLALVVTVILGQLGYAITPLLTSLGIAGLAVAVGLQDTLGNLFAGFSLLFDRPLKTGDWVRLSSGEEGYVREIGWRNTKMLNFDGNVVIVPNAKLAQSIVTNYHLPAEEQNLSVPCRVAYDSDLDRVEEICIQVGRQVLEFVDGSDSAQAPIVRYRAFGDWAIDFVVILRVRRVGAREPLRHEFIKALHAALRGEGVSLLSSCATPGPGPRGQQMT